MQIHATSLAPAQPGVESDAKVREAAKDFEALLIAQLLQSFRSEADDGCFSGSGGSSCSTMLEFAEQHLAQVMSRQGGLGLHDIIMQGLQRRGDSAAEAQTDRR